MQLNHITGAIISASYRIATRLGPGLLESVYEKVLARDLARSGLHVERQKWISFDFEGMWFENAFKVDLLIERAVLVEIKSEKEIAARDKKQVLTYLRLLDLKLGLLINFGAATLKDGIKRIAN
jgi:iron complex transport system substrate-binding protein